MCSILLFVIICATQIELSLELPQSKPGEACSIFVKNQSSDIQHISQLYKNNYFSFYNNNSNEIQTNVHMVSNLNDLISPLVSQRCFVLLDNHAKVSILPLNSPFVIRRMEKILLHKPIFGNRRIWLPTGTIPRMSLVLSNYSTLHSPFSLYLHNLSDLSSHSIISCIDLLQYSPQSKPWNCEVHVHLYLPIIHHSQKLIKTFPAAFSRFSSSEPQKFLFRGVPNLYIHVMNSASLKRHPITAHNVLSMTSAVDAAFLSLFLIALVTGLIENKCAILN